MSSFVRRIQKGIAKAQGYYRDPESGFIYNSNRESTGSKNWPQVSAPTKKGIV